MKPIVTIAFLLAFVALCSGSSQPRIPNTRAEGCVEDSHCGPHCAFEGAKIFPGDRLNEPGKCRNLDCTKDFDILITYCPFDGSGKFEWVGKDDTKLYPECCGTRKEKSA